MTNDTYHIELKPIQFFAHQKKQMNSMLIILATKLPVMGLGQHQLHVKFTLVLLWMVTTAIKWLSN